MEKMGIEQLKMVKEQADLEVNLLQDSLNRIRTAATRLEIASNALQDLSHHPPGKNMLVPLTASLYVPGTLDDADKVLVDVGTGYFIEKTMAEGKDYCDRKINLLKANYDELVECTRVDGKNPKVIATYFQHQKASRVDTVGTLASFTNPLFRQAEIWVEPNDRLKESGFVRVMPSVKFQMVASKKKSMADEAGLVLQAKLRQTASTA